MAKSRATWMRRLAIAGWLCGPVIAVVAVACGSSGSGTTSTTAGTGGGAGGGVPGTDGGDGGPDGDGVPVGLRCPQLLACDQKCTSNACTDNCYAESTGVAQGFFNALNDCISATCSAGPGGPCASPASATCSSCQTGAATGACINNPPAFEGDPAVGPPEYVRENMV